MPKINGNDDESDDGQKMPHKKKKEIEEMRASKQSHGIVPL